MDKKQSKNFILGALLGAALCAMVLKTPAIAEASDLQLQATALGYPVYVNGKMIQLEDALIKDGKTYVQLRDFCSKINVTVDWVDPRYQRMPPPGGIFPEGINLTNPTFVYTAKVANHLHTDKMINGVEITGIYKKYSDTNDENNELKYSFGDEGLIIRENGGERILPLSYNPSYERMYLPIDEFKDKVQPYLVDICMQQL